MSGKFAKRRDVNEPAIVAALLSVGAAVQKLDGTGVPDLLVSYGGVLRLLEVKCVGDGRKNVHRGKGNVLEGERAALTPAQVRWWSKWAGDPPAIVHTPEEALAAIGAKP